MIQSVFRSIEITFNNFCELLSVSINRNWFSINRKSWINFFFKSDSTYSNHFFKILFLSPIQTSTILYFFSFSTKFFAGFSSPPRPVCPSYPFFFIYFQFYMHFFMHWKDIFGLCINWGFWCFKPYFVKLINGFCWYIVIFMINVGQFDQFGVLWWIQNSRACIELELGILF